MCKADRGRRVTTIHPGSELDPTWRVQASQASYGSSVPNHRPLRSSFAHTEDKDLMKAAVITRYGSPDVVEILDAPKPTPAVDEVLIRVHAATVNRTDCGELRAHPFFMRFFTGLRRPKRTILGLDFADEVEAVGAGAASFKPGDRVFGMCPSRSNGA